MGRYISLRIWVGVFEFISQAIGLAILIQHPHLPCEVSDFHTFHVARVFFVTVVLSQFIDVCSMVCCCWMFSVSRIDDDSAVSSRAEHHGFWEMRCRQVTKLLHFICCGMIGGGNINEGFEDVAKVLTNFFHHDGKYREPK